MNNPVYVSSGAFIGRLNGRDDKLLYKIAESIDSDGFEFMMYGEWYDKIEQVINGVVEAGIFYPVIHMDKLIGEYASLGEFAEAERRFALNCKYASMLGAEKAVLHLWNGKPSDFHFERNLEIYPELYYMAKESSIELLCENVVCASSSPMKRMYQMREKYDFVHFTFDTKMAEFHDELKLLYLPEWQWLFDEDRVHHVHLNDYSGGYMNWSTLKTLHIGSGDIDMSKFAEFLKKKKYPYSITLECGSIDENGAPLFGLMQESVCITKSLIK